MAAFFNQTSRQIGSVYPCSGAGEIGARRSDAPTQYLVEGDEAGKPGQTKGDQPLLCAVEGALGVENTQIAVDSFSYRALERR